MNVDANQIRGRTDAGLLEGAGFRWTQPIAKHEKYLNWNLVAGQILLWPTFPIFLFWHSHGFPTLKGLINLVWLVMFILGLAMTFGPLIIYPIVDAWLVEDAGVAFSSHGIIWVTARRRLFGKRSTLNWHHLHRKVSDISSIEREMGINNGGGHYRHGGEHGYLAYDVLIQFTSGERRYVAFNLDDYDSRIVVTQLNIARREIASVPLLAA
jgi:hypothetical protein